MRIILITLLAFTLSLFGGCKDGPSVSRAANEQPIAALNLRSPVNFFTDITTNWQEIPSNLYSPGELKDFLSTTSATNIRYELGTFRDEMIAKFWEESKKAQPDYITLSQEITKKYVEWIRRYLKNTLPMGINENDFAIVAFGSMAREEVAGPYTDLEAAILIKNQDPISLQTARSLASKISFWFNQVGEHPKLPMQKKGFRPDEAANFPFNLAMHAKGITDAEAYCLAYKSLPPEKPASGQAIVNDAQYTKWIEGKDGKDWISKKEFNESYYPFEGTWAFINTPQNMASYLRGARYEFPWPVVLNDSTKEEDWYLFGEKLMKNPMLSFEYIFQELSRSSCAKEIADGKALATAAGKIRDVMIKNELNVISGFDSISRNNMLLFGNPSLYNEFKDEVSKVLDSDENLREKAMVRILHGLVLKFRKDKNGGQMYLNGTLGDVTDVKRILYRFEEQVWTTLGRLANLPVQNVRDIINMFQESGFISREFADQRLALLNSALGLRWKETILANEQTSSNQDYFSPEAHQKEVASKEAVIRDLEQQIDTLVKSQKYRNAKNAVDQLKNILKVEKDPAKKPGIRTDLKAKQKEFADINNDYVRLYNKMVGAKGKLNVLKALDPAAPNPYASKEDIEMWRTTYAKMAQDLFKRVVYLVGGLENIENKEYVIKNQDAFNDDANVPDVDTARLMRIP